MSKIFLVLISFVALLSTLSLPAHAIETAAKQAFLIDMDTHTVLLEKNSDELMHPSSMSKLMTTYILFARMKEGRIKPTDKFPVSEKAWRTQGSKTFVHVGDEIAVEDLIHGIIIQSGNDACIVVAEGISGSEEAFAAEMNRVAKEIGLTKSNFVNSTGWPDDNHLTTARDLATLAERIITDFPDYYHYYSIPDYTYNKIKQQNRNRLLASNIGVDGLKTGHTEVAGFGITLSAIQAERRLILVLNGLESDNQRVEEGDKLLRWGFREFTNKKIADAGVKIDDADVFFGIQKTVPLLSEKNINVTLPAGSDKNISVKVKYTGPIPAPIAKGAHVADLVVSVPGMKAVSYPLIAGEEVVKLSGISHFMAKFKYSLTGSY